MMNDTGRPDGESARRLQVRALVGHEDDLRAIGLAPNPFLQGRNVADVIEVKINERVLPRLGRGQFTEVFELKRKMLGERRVECRVPLRRVSYDGKTDHDFPKSHVLKSHVWRRSGSSSD